MGTPTYQARIQRRVGIITFAGGIIISGSNLLIAVQTGSPFSIGQDWVVSILTLSLMSLGALITSRIDHPWMRLLQVAVFGLLGLWVLWARGTGELMGLLLVAYAILLAIQYDFLERHFVVKIVGALLVTFAVGFTGATVRGGIDVVNGIKGIAFIVFFFLLLWTTFSEEIAEYIARTKELELERRRDSVYVKFGKNVAGLVHNLRNTLGVLYSMNSLVKSAHSPEELNRWISRERQAYDTMNQTLEHMLRVVKAGQQTKPESVNVNELVEALADFVKTDLEFGVGVNLDLRLSNGELIIEAQPLELSQVIQNLLTNSRQAFAERHRSAPTVRQESGDSREARSARDTIAIETVADGRPRIRVSDNGPGIPEFRQCRNEECEAFFSVGTTTKRFGTGLGIPFILEAVKANGWEIVIESEAGRGTATTILFQPPT